MHTQETALIKAMDMLMGDKPLDAPREPKTSAEWFDAIWDAFNDATFKGEDPQPHVEAVIRAIKAQAHREAVDLDSSIPF